MLGAVVGRAVVAGPFVAVLIIVTVPGSLTQDLTKPEVLIPLTVISSFATYLGMASAQQWLIRRQTARTWSWIYTNMLVGVVNGVIALLAMLLFGQSMEPGLWAAFSALYGALYGVITGLTLVSLLGDRLKPDALAVPSPA
jgi:hypothetical protein